MDRVKFGLLSLAILGVAGAVGLIWDNAHQPSDQVQIEQALASAISASKSGSPGNALELLSRNLVVNDQQGGTDRRYIADFIRRQRPQIVVQNLKAQVRGSEGRMVSPVEVDLGLGYGKRTLKSVILTFRKEDGLKYIVVPTQKWRLVEMKFSEETGIDFGF